MAAKTSRNKALEEENASLLSKVGQVAHWKKEVDETRAREGQLIASHRREMGEAQAEKDELNASHQRAMDEARAAFSRQLEEARRASSQQLEEADKLRREQSLAWEEERRALLRANEEAQRQATEEIERLRAANARLEVSRPANVVEGTMIEMHVACSSYPNEKTVCDVMVFNADDEVKHCFMDSSIGVRCHHVNGTFRDGRYHYRPVSISTKRPAFYRPEPPAQRRALGSTQEEQQQQPR